MKKLGWIIYMRKLTMTFQFGYNIHIVQSFVLLSMVYFNNFILYYFSSRFLHNFQENQIFIQISINYQ